MSFLRFNIDGAIPMPLSDEAKAELPEIRAKIQRLKEFCQQIDTDMSKPKRENTIRFKFHICHHDTHEPCEAEQDI